MSYITREDGTRFVIPSYRDVLSTKKTSLLKNEIKLLAENYGNYVVLQKKGPGQYEIALSPDQGYLLGETVWHFFKRPFDLIYCEAIPNTTEAILVVVKSGSVYIDGSFPIDSIADELLIFKTQRNNFDIYISGDVPISEQPEEGKFYLDSNSVRSFQVLPDPIFPTLPTVRAFELLPVDTALKKQGIGVFPVRGLIIGLVVFLLLWLTWRWLTSEKAPLPTVFISVVNPYQVYLNALTSPAPSDIIKNIVSDLNSIITLPGWVAVGMTYADQVTTISVRSTGAKTNILFDWAARHAFKVNATPDGFDLTHATQFNIRPTPNSITRLDVIIAHLADNLSYVIQGNPMAIGTFTSRTSFRQVDIKINFTNITNSLLDLIGQQLQKLPLVLTSANIKIDSNNLSGQISLTAYGT